MAYTYKPSGALIQEMARLVRELKQLGSGLEVSIASLFEYSAQRLKNEYQQNPTALLKNYQAHQQRKNEKHHQS